jgi:hypothetical protein
MVLMVSMGILAVLCANYYFKTREQRNLQFMQLSVNRIQQEDALLNALVSDLVEYRKTNPAIDPILLSIGVNTSGKASANPAKK